MIGHEQACLCRGKHSHARACTLIHAQARACTTAGRPDERPAGWILMRRRTGAAMHATQALKLLPQPQVEVELGLLKTKPRPINSSLKSIVVPLR